MKVRNAVLEVWKPDREHKAIINIPTTVQLAMPHIFACQVEYIHKHLKAREHVILSVHPHNDRGCGVSDAELGVLAGQSAWRERFLEMASGPEMFIRNSRNEYALPRCGFRT